MEIKHSQIKLLYVGNLDLGSTILAGNKERHKYERNNNVGRTIMDEIEEKCTFILLSGN